MNNPDLLLQIVLAEARSIGIPVSHQIDPHVRINRRAATRFGCCMKRQGRFIIELSERLLLSEEIACRQTLAHEVLHTCPNCQNHQACWRTYAMAMNDHFGYSIRRTQSGEELGVEPFGMPRYLLECQQCGAQLRRMRRSSLIDHPERYRCRCGGTLLRKL